MSEEIKITELEVQKINLKEGDVLMGTIKHDDVTQESLSMLNDSLKLMFPLNKVALFAMGSEGYIKFTVVSQPDIGYCSDCDCGKKEIIEGMNKENK